MISTQIALRDFQKQALLRLGEGSRLERAHLLCVAPTGSGKSLIYESLAETGRRVLLLTPLVSLARQQHAKLQALEVDSRLASGGERQKPPQGKSGVWILSPESLPFASTQLAIARFDPELLVVDECHCLWEWGEGFRPAFRFIPELLRQHPIRQSLWLTATMPFEARVQLRESLA